MVLDNQTANIRVGDQIPVTTRSGGILTIHFQQAGLRFSEVYLEGDARIVYRGDLQPDALMA